MATIDPALHTVAFTGPDGNRLTADTAGPADGIPVVLAHGTGQSRHSWGATVAALGARGLRAIAYDLRGHGESDRTEHYSVPRHVEDVRAVLAAVGEPAILVGASLGGIAMLDVLGGAGPPAARALVMIDIGHRFAADGPEKISRFMAGTVDGFDSLDAAAAAISEYLPHRKPRRPGGGLLKTLEQHDDGRFYWRWDPAMMSAERPPMDMEAFERKILGDLRNVTVPTLVIRGENSEILTRDTAEEMRDALPHGQLVEVAGAHHMVAGDDNNAFMAALLAFIDSLDRG